MSYYLENWQNAISEMKYSNTYKCAWGHAILELVYNNDINVNTLSLKFNDISEIIFRYYWNQIVILRVWQGPIKQKPRIQKLIEDIFDKEIDLIYLNFSDPWPKDRHAKRRLTSPRFLARYDKIFKKDKNIIMKTDNKPLFDYSVESLKEYGYTINYLTNDLHSSKENIITTEYEDKFTSQGLKINYLEASKKGDNHESI